MAVNLNANVLLNKVLGKSFTHAGGTKGITVARRDWKPIAGKRADCGGHPWNELVHPHDDIKEPMVCKQDRRHYVCTIGIAKPNNPCTAELALHAEIELAILVLRKERSSMS
jgi:hypothetical protein